MSTAVEVDETLACMYSVTRCYNPVINVFSFKFEKCRGSLNSIMKGRKPTQENESRVIKGQLKLSVYYKTDTLMVMVHHARDLAKVGPGQEPSTYVKVYLKPDDNKSTKRKTKVVKKNCHPTFMEMLEYRLPLNLIRGRTLEATVWSHDSLQENEFLGGVRLPLSDFPLDTETSEWYSLEHLIR